MKLSKVLSVSESTMTVTDVRKTFDALKNSIQVVCNYLFKLAHYKVRQGTFLGQHSFVFILFFLMARSIL